MKKALKELIEKIDKNDLVGQDYIDEEKLCQELNCLYDCFPSDKVDEKLKKYWLHSWKCTDTWVGIAAYFLEGSLVCVSCQNCRKGCEDFEWVSQEKANDVRNFLINLSMIGKVKLIDLDEEIDSEKWNKSDTYTLLKD